jgi:hypothetical protein
VSEIAARIGISDVGLAKACRRVDIPLPSRGYWARVSSGQPIARDPLPPSPAGLPEVIRITGIRTAPTSSKVASVANSNTTDRAVAQNRHGEKAAA